MKKVVVIGIIVMVLSLMPPLVSASTPVTFTSFSPTHARTGDVVDITVRGSGFTNNCGLCLNNAISSPPQIISAQSMTFVNSTEVIGRGINLSGIEASTTTWFVTLFIDGDGYSSMPNHFVIDSPLTLCANMSETPTPQ
jgi:hypothetical protein